MTINIDPEGRLSFIHDDRLKAALADLGRSRTKRASHVEPDDNDRWWADLSPVGGPNLGPFDARGEALAAEVEWLDAKLLTGSL